MPSSSFLLHHTYHLRSASSRFAFSISLRPSPALLNLRSGHGGALHPPSFPFLRYRALRTLADSPARRLGFSHSVRAAARSVDFNWPDSVIQGSNGSPFWYQPSREYGRFAYDEYHYSDEENVETGSDKKIIEATSANVDEWKWKFNAFLRKKFETEIVSKERKDRRDFGELSALATSMGLHSCQYAKVVVFSKVPLPNYRSDLDEKRPQREVVLPAGLEKEVNGLLRNYLAHKPTSSVKGTQSISDRGVVFDEQLQPSAQPTAAMEGLLRQRSNYMRNKQQAWLDSPEGKKMLGFRRTLPAYKQRDALLKAVSENQVVVVSGETGCGKTTQLPQYILESEIEAARGASCSIVCTQPRRISAISVSERVAAERGENIGESIGYKVRLEGMKGRDTRLLFCTTGVLLRRLLLDRGLTGVTHIIVDEIHERGMNEDFLLIVLKDLLPRRPDLRLILMSATMNADLFSSYFGGAPMLHIPGFTHPVQAHFLENILATTGYRLTPYNQVDDYGQGKLWKTQQQTLRKRKTQIASVVEETLETANFEGFDSRTRESLRCWNPDSIGFNLIEQVLCHICRKERPGAILVFMTGWDDINSFKDQLRAHPLLGNPSRVLVLACHGSMASSEQRLIFDKPPDGIRKIVLATNMAETSITINDVVFVVDCGKAKETSYDALNNTPCLLPTWISKAAAIQRRGRAGRVQPGECYHIYPKCVYDAFADYQLPELLRTPLQSLCLQIKSLGLGSVSEFLSRALQSPEPLSVQNAIAYLKTIGALDENENLTVLGKSLSMLPVEPKLGKMLILGAIFKCLDPIMTVVAGLSVRDPFVAPFDKRDHADSAKARFAGREFSDHLAIVRAYDGWKAAERQQAGSDYCYRNFLSSQALKSIDSTRTQFYNLLKESGFITSGNDDCNTWGRDMHLVRAIICAGLFPGVCSVVNKSKSIQLKTLEDGQVLLHPGSVNAQPQKLPFPWLVFNEKMKVNSVFLRDSTAVSDSALLLFGGDISSGADGYLQMMGGYLEFFMKPSLADTYLSLKRELGELIQNKLLNRNLDVQEHEDIFSAVRKLITDDTCEGKSVFGRRPLPAKNGSKILAVTYSPPKDDNTKGHLQTLLTRAGHALPSYNTRRLNGYFRSIVAFNGMEFIGEPFCNKKQAEQSAAAKAISWLMGESDSPRDDLNRKSTPLKKTENRDDFSHISALLKKAKSKKKKAKYWSD